MTRALAPIQYVVQTRSPGCFAIADPEHVASIFVDPDEHPGLRRAASDLQADIARLTGHPPAIISDERSIGNNVIVIGTIGNGRTIDRLIERQRLDANPITGKWESFWIEVLREPSLLIIAGSDPRGTIYGIYDLCQQI